MVKVHKTRGSGVFIPKWNIYNILLSVQSSASLQSRRQKDCQIKVADDSKGTVFPNTAG